LNLNRGLIYYLINLVVSKLYVFINSLFISNKDLILYLGYIIILINKSISESEFIIYNNIIYYLLTKNKRVIRSILALKVYSIVNGVNLAYITLIILKKITDRLSFLLILTVIYIDSYSLYKYFIKLRTIKKKRLIINIIALR
ncbi:hypothetical protein CCUS01_00670, partial [Colletotrichum cuscutae]